MPNSNDYPRHVSEVIDPNMKFRPAVLRAVRAYAKAKPYQGTLEQQREKIRVLYGALAAAYSIPMPTLLFEGDGDGDSGQSCAIRSTQTVVLRGRVSVVTCLHEFRHLLGGGERAACRFSLNLFRRCFPRSYSRLTFSGHMARRPETDGEVQP